MFGKCNAKLRQVDAERDVAGRDGTYMQRTMSDTYLIVVSLGRVITSLI